MTNTATTSVLPWGWRARRREWGTRIGGVGWARVEAANGRETGGQSSRTLTPIWGLLRRYTLNSLEAEDWRAVMALA